MVRRAGGQGEGEEGEGEGGGGKGREEGKISYEMENKIKFKGYSSFIYYDEYSSLKEGYYDEYSYSKMKLQTCLYKDSINSTYNSNEMIKLSEA